LVATIPPSVADSREARSTPNRSPKGVVAASSAVSVTPACTPTQRPTVSRTSMSVMRAVESTIAGVDAPAGGIDPPTSPVLPPWAQIAMPASAQIRTTAATSSVVRGLTTATAEPVHLPVQSVR